MAPEYCVVVRNFVDTSHNRTLYHPPGSRFPAPGGRLHYWSAVELEGNWRLVDTVCAARAAAVAENFFLPDPEEFIYTHFPHNQAEAQYFRWQLLLPPLR